MRNYLTVKQVCERLPVGRNLVYALIARREIPSVRLGGKILVPEDDLEKVLTPRPREPEKGPAPLSPARPKAKTSRGKGGRFPLRRIQA